MAKTYTRSRKHGIIVSLIISGTALFQTAHFAADIYLNYAFVDFPTAEAIISSSKIETIGRCLHHPTITYEYDVGYAHYVSSKYSYNETICEEPRADEIVGLYPASTKVNIHYNPSNPAQSLLVAGHVSTATWGFLIMFLSIAIWCLFTLKMFWKRPSEDIENSQIK